MTGAVSKRVVELEHVRRRLEAFLMALYGRHFVIAPSDPAPEPGYWRKHIRRKKPRPRATRGGVATDGARIWLPRALADEGDLPADDAYRAIALLQAELCDRDVPRHWPQDASILERDLFALYEGARAEVDVARRHPGIAPALQSLRQRAFDRRRLLLWPSASSRHVASLIDDVLARPVGEWPPSLPEHFGVESSLAWARRRARSFNSRLYRPQLDVWHWAAIIASKEARVDDARQREIRPTWKLPIGIRPAAVAGARGSIARRTRSAGPSADPSTADAQSQSALVPDPSGAPGAAWPDAEPRLTRPAIDAGAVLAARYREWDHQIRDFIPEHAAVYESTVPASDPAWAARAAAANAGLIRRVQREFHTLGARRVRLTRQQDGDDLDLAACVDFMVDISSGHTPDDRVYALTRPPRGGVALGILADTSGSAGTALGTGASGSRIIDVERVALLVATYAMEATGDRHAILSFASMGAAHVAVRAVKSFDERGGTAVGDRIASLAPAGRTRLGAAIRHATSIVVRERAARHLLLVLSDGIPNDSEHYIEEYGIEDARIAVLEARAMGVKPHCLTLSADEHYAVRIFGPAAQVLVRRPEHLPRAVLTSLAQLLRH